MRPQDAAKIDLPALNGNALLVWWVVSIDLPRTQIAVVTQARYYQGQLAKWAVRSVINCLISVGKLPQASFLRATAQSRSVATGWRGRHLSCLGEKES